MSIGDNVDGDSLNHSLNGSQLPFNALLVHSLDNWIKIGYALL